VGVRFHVVRRYMKVQHVTGDEVKRRRVARGTEERPGGLSPGKEI